MSGLKFRFLAVALSAMSGLLLGVACSERPASPQTTAPVSATPVLPQNPTLTVIPVGRDFGLGKDRLQLAILSADGDSVNDRAADLEITYGLIDGSERRTLTPVTWRKWPVLSGVYVATADFDSSGFWQFDVVLDDGSKTLAGSATLEVRDVSRAPSVGTLAPRVVSKTAGTLDAARQITSAATPDLDLYATSLDKAIESQKPIVVVFSTPAFCTTQTCGPQLEVIGNLQDKYGAEAQFIHVEVWDNPREMLDTGDASVGRLSPAVEAWGLPSEPWTFLIDTDGRIHARFEAFATEAELDEAIASWLAAS